MLNQEKEAKITLSSESALDNYSRLQMVILIEQLHELKRYRIETLYTAVSLADRQLSKINSESRNLPCLISLATVCVLMAAKLEESMSPSFIRMVDVVHEQYSIVLKK